MDRGGRPPNGSGNLIVREVAEQKLAGSAGRKNIRGVNRALTSFPPTNECQRGPMMRRATYNLEQVNQGYQDLRDARTFGA